MSISFEVRRMMAVEASLAEGPHADGITPLVNRVRGEFLEMPGLRLTPAQASRLWAIDRHTSEGILDALASAGFLLKNRNGAYMRASVA